MSDKISTDRERKIIDDFATEIEIRREPGSKPEHAVIEFRNDRKIGKIRGIYLIPIKLLRLRKDNGRLASDIASYEKMHCVLDETLESTQNIIREFLRDKDVENNAKLSKSIEHSGQIEPAIITCDGFLINGNRRKMVIEDLFNKTKDKNYETMKVVILPGKGNEGGPPTIREIEQIENRYQLQSDGKSEYTNFDRAISIKRKIRAGMSLQEQLLDDPSLAGLTEKEFNKEERKYQDQFLGPLERIDEYLEQLKRSGLYGTISEGKSDKEGRWYSFIDYYKLYKQLQNEKRRTELEVEEDEIGDIEDIAFKIIRKKDFPDHKTHEVIRKLTKILKNRDAKKELMKIDTEAKELDEKDINEDDDLKTIDKKWGSKNAELIVGRVRVAIRKVEHDKELETPLTLLHEALKKLNHENMDPDTLDISKLDKAFEKSKEIQARAGELESEFWERKKKLKKLLGKR